MLKQEMLHGEPNSIRLNQAFVWSRALSYAVRESQLAQQDE